MGDDGLTSMAETVFGIIGSGVALTAGASFTSNRMRPQTQAYYLQHVYDRFFFRSLRRNLDEESWRWPMYARPVLYNEIDHTVHYHFSTAEQAWKRCEELDNLIGMPQLQPESLLERISPAHIVNRLIQQLFLRIQIKEYEKLLNAIALELDQIRQLHQDERKTERKVVASVEALRERIDNATSTIGNFGSFKEYRDEIDTTLKVAQNAYEYSFDQVNPFDPDGSLLNNSDGSNYASASVHSRLGNQMLDYFDLYLRWVKISDTFFLDIFKARMDNAKKIIQVTLNEKAVTDWFGLYRVEFFLNHIDRKLNSSQNALDDFNKNEKIFQGLANQLRTIQLVQLTDESKTMEANCDGYWCSRQEDPRYWNKVLSDRSLPSQQLEKSKVYYQSAIAPTLESGRIKQSAMRDVNTRMQVFIQFIGQARQDLAGLEKELNYHKECQAKFYVLVGENGPARRALVDVVKVEKDTSGDIKQRCLTHRQQFEAYLARADAVRGADFPNILGDIDDFIASCIRTKNDHDAMILRMSIEASARFSALSAAKERLREYQQERPNIEWGWSESISKLEKIIWVYTPNNLSYEYLNTFIQKADAANSIAQEELKQIYTLRSDYTKRYRKTERELQKMAAEIKKYYEGNILVWEWEKAELIKKIPPIIKASDEMIERFKSAPQRFETTSQVMRECESIEEQIQPTLSRLTDIVGKIRERQEKFSNRYKYLTKVARATTNSIAVSPEIADRIKSLCTIAVSDNDPDDVEAILESAWQLVLSYKNGTLNPQYIAHVDTLINNHGVMTGSNYAPGGNIAIGVNTTQTVRK